MVIDMGDQPAAHHQIGDDAELGIAGLVDVTVLGSGGSSTVYRAHQPALDRQVAVKVVHGAWSIDTKERFDREREVMGRLSGHAAIVPVFETGITRRGEPYLIMPYYERGSLFRLMKDRGPLPWREAAFIMEILAQALADCHGAGIVHRDVKPGNILLTDHLQPRIADFGITLPGGTPTDGSAVAYTPSYSPPEAFKAGAARPTTDVYSLGATLWALLAGRAPFTRDGSSTDVDAIMERSIHEQPGRPAGDTPDPIAAVIDRAMHKEPGKRPVDAGEFAAELRRATRLAEQRRPPPQVTGRTTRDRLITAVLAGLVVAGVLLITGAALWLIFG